MKEALEKEMEALENVIQELNIELVSVANQIVNEIDPENRKTLGAQQANLQDSIVKYEHSLLAKTQVINSTIGPHEKVLNESLKNLKMNQEKHFGGDAIQGNRLHKGYESNKRNDFTVTKCFENEPEIRKKFNALWDNLSEFETFISIRNPTDTQCEEAAVLCENWCKIYPVFFPNKNLTPKMTVYSLVLPRFIREN